MALVRLAEYYEDAMARSFEDATSVLHGLRDLIAYHPELRDYHEALNWIVEGDRYLNEEYARVTLDRHSPQADQRKAAVISICDCYETAMGKRFEDAIQYLGGLCDLIARHPKLREHHQAMTWLLDGHQVLIKMYHKVSAL